MHCRQGHPGAEGDDRLERQHPVHQEHHQHHLPDTVGLGQGGGRGGESEGHREVSHGEGHGGRQDGVAQVAQVGVLQRLQGRRVKYLYVTYVCHSLFYPTIVFVCPMLISVYLSTTFRLCGCE